LSSGKDLTHLGDVVLQEVLVQKVSDLLAADEFECRDSSPQLETLISWLWKKFVYDLRLCSFGQRGGGGCFSYILDERHTS